MEEIPEMATPGFLEVRIDVERVLFDDILKEYEVELDDVEKWFLVWKELRGKVAQMQKQEGLNG